MSTASKKQSLQFPTDKPRSLWDDAARTFRYNKAGVIGLAILLLVVLIAVLAPLIAPYEYDFQDWDHLREGPSLAHPMGTDALGRDLFSRIIMGIRTAFLVGVIVTVITAIIGVLMGALGGLLGGWVDSVVVWIIDGLLNFPAIWLAAFVVVITRPAVTELSASLYESTGWGVWRDTVVLDYLVIFGVLSFVWWPPIGRLVRGQVLSLREQEFIVAGRSIGASNWRLIVRHLVPNVLGQVLVAMSTGFGNAMLAESSLSFLGIGIRPPGASLGQLIFAGLATWRADPHLVAMPGLTLAIIVLASIFVGDGLNDALNPRIRER